MNTTQSNYQQHTPVQNSLAVPPSVDNAQQGHTAGKFCDCPVAYIRTGKALLRKTTEHPIDNPESPWIRDYDTYVKAKTEVIKHDIQHGLYQPAKSLFDKYMEIIDAKPNGQRLSTVSATERETQK